MKALWITDEEMQLLKQQRVKITPEGFMAPDDQSHIECSEPEPDLEFKSWTFEHARDEMGHISLPDLEIEHWLNRGWELYDKIICPPVITLIFSREKEAAE
jgi:hypothetical protein